MTVQIVTTVTAAAGSYDLTDLATVKDELGIDSGNTDDDALLERYITSASRAAAQYCNRVLVVETLEDDFWPQRDPWPWDIPGGVAPLQLSRWPITGLGVVTENGVTLTSGTDFRPDNANGQLIRLDANGYPRKWPAFALSAAYSAGFDPIPADLEDAVIRMVSARYAARGRDPKLKSISIPDVQDVTYWIATGDEAGNMSPDIADILDNYRVPVAV